MQNLSSFDRKVIAFYTMLTNAYLDEDDRNEIPEVLELKHGCDLNEDVTAMLGAIRLFVEKVSPESVKGKDFIDFTYMLNRLAIQHVYQDQPVDLLEEDDDEDEFDEEEE